MYQGHLYNVPIEILERIIASIDDPRDLLTFAVCSKAVYRLVIPYPIQLRRIRCDISQNNLWNVFLNHPHLAMMVRKLHVARLGSSIMTLYPPPLPGTLSFTTVSLQRYFENPYSNPILLVTAAMRYMDLNEFSWESGVSTDIHILDLLRALFHFNRRLKTLRLTYLLRNIRSLQDHTPPLAVSYYSQGHYSF